MPTAKTLSFYKILLLFTELGRWPAYIGPSCALGLLWDYIVLNNWRLWCKYPISAILSNCEKRLPSLKNWKLFINLSFCCVKCVTWSNVTYQAITIVMLSCWIMQIKCKLATYHFSACSIKQTRVFRCMQIPCKWKCRYILLSVFGSSRPGEFQRASRDERCELEKWQRHRVMVRIN